MNKLWQVFRYELVRNFLRKGYLFITFLLPPLLFVGFILLAQLIGGQVANNRSDDPTEVNLPADLSRSIQRAGYIDQTGRFGDPGELSSILTQYDDEAAAQAALDAGEIDVYYVIPADYMETGEVQQVMPRLTISMVSGALMQRLILSHLAEGVDAQVFERLVDPSNVREISVERPTADGEGVEQGFDARIAIVYVFAIILLGSLFLTNGYLLQSVIEEKETRLIEILVSAMRPFDLLAGKILALGVLGLLQIVVWIGMMSFFTWLSAREAITAIAPVVSALTSLTIPLDILPLLFIYFVLAYLLFAGLFGIIGALSNSMREGPQYAVVFTLPAVIPFYFISVFAATPNATLPVVLSLIPITAPIAMAQRLAITQVPPIEIAVSLILLALSALGAFWLAGRIFRVSTLLAGQMPKLRDLPKLVRG
jgi:ABC-2 type transport system permease protein